MGFCSTRSLGMATDPVQICNWRVPARRSPAVTDMSISNRMDTSSSPDAGEYRPTRTANRSAGHTRPARRARCSKPHPMASIRGLGILIVVSACGIARGAADDAGDPARQLFGQHCQKCHAGPKHKGDFQIESLTGDFADSANRERWLAVLEQLKSGDMPPEERPRPPGQEVPSRRRLDRRARREGGDRPARSGWPGGLAATEPGRVCQHGARSARRGGRSYRPATAGYLDQWFRQQRRGHAHILLPDAELPRRRRSGIE